MKLGTTIAVLLILVSFVVLILVHLSFPREGPIIPPDSSHYAKLIPHPGLMLLFVFLFFAYIIHAIIENYEIPVPCGVFIVFIAYTWGLFCYHFDSIHVFNSVMYMDTTEFLYVYMPAIVFSIAFSTDVPIFVKTLPQIAVISIPVALLTAVLYGLLSIFVFSSDWPPQLGLFFGIICAPTNPQSIITLFKQQSTTTKQIGVLLEGESMILIFVVQYIYKLLYGYLSGMMTFWFQYLAVTARMILIGILTGFIFGYISRYLMRKMYSNRTSVFVTFVGIPFFTYAASDIFLSGCGSISVLIVGAILGRERTILPKDIERFLTDFWDIAAYIVDVVMCIKIATYTSVYITPGKGLADFGLLTVTYVLYYIMRLISFLVFSPIISRLGYGMDLRNMIVLVCGGLKCPLNLCFIATMVEQFGDVEELQRMQFQIFGLYFLSMLINGAFMGTLLEFTGLRVISLAKQLNMNICMKHIFTKREKTIAILKMDRFLADANWQIVLESTNMKHPYQIGMSSLEDDEILGLRSTWCGECKKEIPQQPSPKEMREMTKEAKRRILKVKKMSYSRQYENGMMSKEGIRILSQAVELAMDSEAAEVQMDQLHKRFLEEGWFIHWVRKRAEELHKRRIKAYKPPRTYWRRLCYHLVITNNWFEKVMLVVVLLHISLIIVDSYYHPALFFKHKYRPHSKSLEYVLITGKIFFALIFLLELIIKVLAYSWIYIWSHGVRTYFRSFWNIADFLVVIACFVDITDSEFNIAEAENLELYRKKAYLHNIFDYILLLRFIRLLRTFDLFYADMIWYLDRKADTIMAFTFELGKSFAKAENEILDMLPLLIDDPRIRNEMKQQIETQRLIITKLIGTVQKEKPWIAITVKTTQAIRTILNSMSETLNQLKSAGWVDNFEYEKLSNSLDDLFKKVNAIKKVPPSPPKVIFQEVAWMVGDENVIEFLFDNVETKTFEAGEVIFQEGTVADGIYIVVTGLLLMTYKPDLNTIFRLHEYGKLPIVDYFSGLNFEEPTSDYIVSGNCIGELSTLTDRGYNSVITADSHSQVYVLNRGVLKRAMELSPDPINGLECRIWKEIGIRIALPILLTVPAYQSTPQDQIKYALERAFVPNLDKFKIFAVTDVIEDIILVEGAAADYNTRDNYVAPCYIPRTVQKLILPSSSLMNLLVTVDTKLLIIPAKDVDEYEVMGVAEETCEMVDGSTTKCIQHTVLNRIKNRRKKGRTSGHTSKSHMASSVSTHGSSPLSSVTSSSMHISELKSESDTVRVQVGGSKENMKQQSSTQIQRKKSMFY